MSNDRFNIAEALEKWGNYHPQNLNWRLEYEIAEAFDNEEPWFLQMKKTGLLNALKDGMCIAYGLLSPVHRQAKPVAIWDRNQTFHAL